MAEKKVRRQPPVDLSKMLRISAITTDCFFHLDSMLGRAIAAALTVYDTGPKCEKALCTLEFYMDILTDNLEKFPSVANDIAMAVYYLPDRLKSKLLYARGMRILMRLPMRMNTMSSMQLCLHLNPRYVNRQVVGLSPGLFVALTMADLKYTHAIKALSNYGDQEVDAFMAAAHLLRGMEKYNCIFRGCSPDRMYMYQSSVIGVGCLKVLKITLKKPDFLVALLALSVKYCNMSADMPNCSSDRLASADELMKKVHKTLRKLSKPKTSAISKMISRLRVSASESTCHPSIAHCVKYILNTPMVSPSLQIIKWGDSSECLLDVRFCSKLIMFAEAAGLRGQALHLVLSTYWQLILQDKRAFNNAYCLEDQRILKRLGIECERAFASENHLQIIVDKCKNIERHVTLRHLFCKLTLANIVTDMPLEGKKTIAWEFLQMECRNPSIHEAVQTLYRQLEGQLRDM